MPRACPRERSHSALRKTNKPFSGCHGLVPWSAPVRRYKRQAYTSPDATGSPRGVLTFAATKDKHTLQQMPRACPVECSPSLLQKTSKHFSSGEREHSTGQARGIFKSE